MIRGWQSKNIAAAAIVMILFFLVGTIASMVLSRQLLASYRIEGIELETQKAQLLESWIVLSDTDDVLICKKGKTSVVICLENGRIRQIEGKQITLGNKTLSEGAPLSAVHSFFDGARPLSVELQEGVPGRDHPYEVYSIKDHWGKRVLSVEVQYKRDKAWNFLLFESRR